MRTEKEMRTEQQMMALILGVAERDARVRAVYMNGSRAIPTVPKDAFQDYDIVYVVTEIASFRADPGWIDVFGPRIMLQEPDRMDHALGQPIDLDAGYGYLMLFADGNRIDLSLQALHTMPGGYLNDSATVPLRDKDGLLPPIPPASDQSYWVKPPTAAEYESVTNNFWWCLQNVAKGLCRNELPYARRMVEVETRGALHRMLCWQIGLAHAFRVMPGKDGKYFMRYLPPAQWALYMRTLGGDPWEAIDAACALFREAGRAVGAGCGFAYPEADDAAMTGYLLAVRN